MSRHRPLVVLGSVVLALAGLMVVTGVALVAAFGSGDALATGSHRVTTPTRALVSSVAQIDGLSNAPSGLGEVRIEVDATSRTPGTGVFVGVARAADVDRYLAGADVDVVTDFEVAPFGLTTRRQPGTTAVRAPGTQDFWVARAEARSGTTHLAWPMQDGDYRLVLMDADGASALDADARFGIALPSALTMSVLVLTVGVGLALLGGALLAVSRVAPRSAGTSPPPPSEGARPAGPPPVGTRTSV